MAIAKVINGTSGFDYLLARSTSDEYRMTVNYGVTDIVDGGTGTDTLSYQTADRGVTVTMAAAGKFGHTEADFVTRQFINPVTGELFQNIETQTATQFKNIENVTGSRFADTINGNSGVNRIDGGAGKDTIDGGGGADTIVGGRGADILRGGGDADTFVFSSFLDSTEMPVLTSQFNGYNGYDPSVGQDSIMDFLSGTDKIDLSGIDANSTISGNQEFDVVDAFSGRAGELIIVDSTLLGNPDAYNPGYYIVHGDIDGDGQRDFSFSIMPASVDVFASDFIL